MIELGICLELSPLASKSFHTLVPRESRNQTGLRIIYNRCTLVQLINTVKQIPSWEAVSSTVSQKIPCILWKPVVHNLINQGLSFTWWSQSTFLHPIVFKIYLTMSFYLHPDPSYTFPHKIPSSTYPVFHTRHMPVFLLVLIARIVYGKIFC